MAGEEGKKREGDGHNKADWSGGKEAGGGEGGTTKGGEDNGGVQPTPSILGRGHTQEIPNRE